LQKDKKGTKLLFSMKLNLCALLFYATSLFAANSSVSGKVNLRGPRPTLELVKMGSDPVCVSQNGNKPVYKEDVQVNANGMLGDVIVYLKEGVVPTPGNTQPVVLDQTGCHYIPHVVAVHTDQPIKIVNSDPTLHNVNARPKLNSGFNIGMAVKGQEIEKKFSKPEIPIRLRCDVHGWMNAWIGVFDHPYYAVTDMNGNFVIKNVPPGQYVIETWSEKYGQKNAKLNVDAAGGLKKVDFSYP
jgi:hypothetical protein